MVPGTGGTPGYVSSVPIAKYTRADGFTIGGGDGPTTGGIEINGVRAFDPALGSWTTPDAFEGDIHDPASQQKYMWNRGNPVDYSDPNGFESQRGWYDTKSGLPDYHYDKVEQMIVGQMVDILLDMVFTGWTVVEGIAGARGAVRGGKPLEIPSGTISESGFLGAATEYLGKGYTEPSSGRYVSADGMRQVRFGAHETRPGKEVHAHFEAYDKPAGSGGKVIESSTATVVPDKK
jgi:RHS repeat-associated protein